MERHGALCEYEKLVTRMNSPRFVLLQLPDLFISFILSEAFLFCLFFFVHFFLIYLFSIDLQYIGFRVEIVVGGCE